jgi:hypothetical protein
MLVRKYYSRIKFTGYNLIIRNQNKSAFISTRECVTIRNRLSYRLRFKKSYFNPVQFIRKIIAQIYRLLK